MKVDYQLVQFSEGNFSLEDIRLHESMHSTIGPWEEANQIYVGQSNLVGRLAEPASEPLVIFDIGLGIGANALASIECFLNHQPNRNLHIVSFETDPMGLRVALQLKDRFPFISRHEELLQDLLQNRSVERNLASGRRLQWTLHIGDFRDFALTAPCPELIYYDLYSPKSLPELWGLQAFNLLYRATQLRRSQGLSSQLITYSTATSARSALLLAGFYVGEGISTAAKRETTLASTDLRALQRPLGQGWMQHWKRSGKPLPDDFLYDRNTAAEWISKQLGPALPNSL